MVLNNAIVINICYGPFQDMWTEIVNNIFQDQTISLINSFHPIHEPKFLYVVSYL
jgi:hypothetical protein